jgi:hypothetical protein
MTDLPRYIDGDDEFDYAEAFERPAIAAGATMPGTTCTWRWW